MLNFISLKLFVSFAFDVIRMDFYTFMRKFSHARFISFSYDFLQISKYFFKMKIKAAFLCEKLIFILKGRFL